MTELRVPLNPFILGTCKQVLFSNSEVPDEMLRMAAFHQGLHCLLGYKQSSWAELHRTYGHFAQQAMKYT